MTPPTDAPPTDTPPTERPPTQRPPTPPPPTPTPDNQAPTGIDVAISKNVVFSTKVDVDLKATGATEMRLGRTSIQGGACNWGGWTSFARSASNVTIDGGQLGKRWVCAQFRDARGNTSGDTRDSVLFDNAPTLRNGLYFSFSASTLSGKSSFTTRFFDPVDSLHILEDEDGLSTLKVTSLWLINNNGSTVNYTNNLINGGVSAKFDIPSNYCGAYNIFKYGFTGSDSYKARTGFFYIEVCTA